MNQILILSPYKHRGIWVFDDERTGLVREAFVAGIDTILDRLTRNIERADRGFNLIFSADPFPGHEIHLAWTRGDKYNQQREGNWYHCANYELDGWLCPAMFLYFPVAPDNLYAQAKAIK